MCLSIHGVLAHKVAAFIFTFIFPIQAELGKYDQRC